MQTKIKGFMGTDTTLAITAGRNVSYIPPKSYVAVSRMTEEGGVDLWSNTFDDLDANKVVYNEVVAMLKAIHKN